MFKALKSLNRVSFIIFTGIVVSSTTFAAVSQTESKSIRSFPALASLLDNIDMDAGNDCVVGRVILEENVSVSESNTKGCTLISSDEAVKKISSFFKSSISHFGYDDEYLASIGASEWKSQVQTFLGQQDYYNCAVYDVDVNLVASELNYSLVLNIAFED